MLQAPSHLSRVCGHGHIKKFWIMQTQKESQACDSKTNLVFPSPTSRPSNRGSVKGVENAPWTASSPHPHSSGFVDAAGTPSKHATYTCAESLSPSPISSKSSPTPSPSLGSSGVETEKDRLNGHYDCLDSISMAVYGDAHSTAPSHCARSVNAPFEMPSQVSIAPLTEAGSEPSPARMNSSSKEPSSSFTGNSPDSNSSQFSRGNQVVSAHRPLESGSSQAAKVEDRSSPANVSRDIKPITSHVRFTASLNVDHSTEKGRNGGILSSRMQEIDHDRLTQAAYMQHAVLKACSLCGTTKTPMWRSGPQGPKSLCNACGIRFKKYRSFPGQEPTELMSPLLGSAVSKPLSRPLKRKQNSLLPACEPPRPPKISLKPVDSDVTPRQQLKKSRWHQLVVEREHNELEDFSQTRSSTWFTRAGPPSLKKIYGCSPFQSKFKKIAPMDDHLSVSGVFAKDEEEAAVLLMHLSCGLVY